MQGPINLRKGLCTVTLMTEYDFDEKNDLLGCGVRLEKSLSETAELTRQCSTNWRTRSYGRQSCIPIGRVQAVAEPNFGQSLALHSSWRFFVLSNYNFTSRFPLPRKLAQENDVRCCDYGCEYHRPLALFLSVLRPSGSLIRLLRGHATPLHTLLTAGDGNSAALVVHS